MVATADSAGFGGLASMARADDPRSKRQSHGSKVQAPHGTRNVVKRRVLDILYYILLRNQVSRQRTAAKFFLSQK